MAAADDREFDIVLLGATGFTGGLTADYLGERLAGTDVTWAIAGRNPSKLADVRDRLVAATPDADPVRSVEVDAHDLTALVDLAGRTRVLATTVGPYADHGELVVQACARQGTDYVDITGEPSFVDLVLRRYDGEARDTGARIVNCCGFDSIPHDLGAYYTVRQLPSDGPIQVRAFVSARMQWSGGTVNTAIDAIAAQGLGAMRGGGRPRPDDGREVRGLPRRVQRVPEIDGYAVPMPTIDPLIVLRSAAALEEYGPRFAYGHYARVGGAAMAAGIVGAAGAGAALATFAPTRALLRRLVPSPGEGPSEETRAKSWFRVTFLGEGSGRRVRTEVRGGDPGYDETAKMLAESALCLLQDELPERAGVLTPTVAMGEALQARLEARGIEFEVVDWDGGA